MKRAAPVGKRVGIVGYTLIAAALAASCGSRREAPPSADTQRVIAPPAGSELRPVALPDFSPMEPSVRAQMETASAALREAVGRSGGSPVAIGTAYGEMGMLLMAATELEAAEACYLNAQALVPSEPRWPYYLGHLYKIKGPLEGSIAAFERALALRPDDVATLVWLGGAYVEHGDVTRAAPLFDRALALQPTSAAAHVGAGRAALARKDYATAVQELEKALALDPGVNAPQYALAMAYRGLGDADSAQAHLALTGDIEARPTDPLMQEIDELLRSPEAYNVRGGRALDAGNWAAAADNFRKGLALRPSDPSLRHRLGTALYQMGDVQGALEQFQQVVRTSPEFSRAHYSLGVLMNDAGRYQEAVGHFQTALQYDPTYLQAHLQLAGVLGRIGRPAEALEEYRRAVQIDPTRADAAFAYAMTLVRLGRYREARDRMADEMEARPDQPVFGHALARLLAAAPDDGVRDGPRALRLVEGMVGQGPSLDLGETSAMALAEVGRYKEAVVVQRNVIAAAEEAGVRDAIDRMTANLRLYERERPCRTPFTEDQLP